jgi:hypothetical protein
MDKRLIDPRGAHHELDATSVDLRQDFEDPVRFSGAAKS